jgi:hypothetical protein
MDYMKVLSTPVTEEIGAVGREIESFRALCGSLKRTNYFQNVYQPTQWLKGARGAVVIASVRRTIWVRILPGCKFF